MESEMVLASNSTDCYNFINHTGQLITNLSVYGATGFIGVVSSLTAIFLILIAKTHKEFINRLLLYMASVCFLTCLTTIAYNFESDYNVRYEISKPTNILMGYFVYVYSFLLCWLGLYLFSLAVFRVQLKKPKHEAIGLVIVLVTPLTFLWVFYWKTRKSEICEDTYSLNEIRLTLCFNIPILLSHLFSCFFIGAVLITLCKNAVDRVENTLQQQHRKAVREIVPLVVFMIAHQILLIFVTVIVACQLLMAEEGKKAPFIMWESYDMWPIVTVSIPILLLCQPRIRRRLKCKRPQRLINVNITSGYDSTVQQSNQSSYTYYSSLHETVGTH